MGGNYMKMPWMKHSIWGGGGGGSAVDAKHELLPIQEAVLQSDTGIEGSTCNIVKLDLNNKSFIIAVFYT